MTTVLPLSAGTFLTSRAETSLNDFAVSKISLISSVLISCKSNKFLLVHSLIFLAPFNYNLIFLIIRFFQNNFDILIDRRWNIFPDIVGAHGQFPMSAVNENS